MRGGGPTTGANASEVTTTGALRPTFGLLDIEGEDRDSIDGPVGTVVARRKWPRSPALGLAGRDHCGKPAVFTERLAWLEEMG